jgi:hypothetical protein
MQLFSLNLSQPLWRFLLTLVLYSLHMSLLPGGHLREDNRERNGQRTNGKKNPDQVTMSVLSAFSVIHMIPELQT